MIRHQALYLKKHIESLMNSVIAEHHSKTHDESKVIINSLVRRAVEELATQTTDKKGHIILQLEDDNVRVRGDEDQLYLAIFNVLSNSIKYSLKPKVVVTTYSRNGEYLVRIRDNGVGIEKKEVNNIFRKFYRVQNGNIHQAKGLGLGLYFTKKVISSHAGAVKVDSTPGEGSTFTISLPIEHS
jgi:two-component system phosphate regulon sensor histidine kinase PhoR